MQQMPAKTLDADWQDLRLLMIVAREGGFAAAARRTGLHETTLARRVARLEAVLSKVLWLAHSGGGTLTPAGRALLPAIEAAELALAPVRVAPATGGLSGRVRMSVVPWLVAIIARHLPCLAGRHPDLWLDIEAEQAARDPLRGEVDLALRFAPPGADSALVGRRLCNVAFGVFCRPGSEDAPWIGYTEGYAHLPQAAWHGGAAEGHRVSDLASACHLVAAGLGRAYLPLVLAPDGSVPLPGAGRRPVWILLHPRMQGDPGLRAVIDWFDACVVPDLRGNDDKAAGGDDAAI
jgi:DNA-binding transcriptional LysR family regulator